MKLVDILARELKVWPDDGTDVVGQSSDGCLHLNAACAPNRGFTEEAYKLSSDWNSTEVTRAEWQAAVDALNAPKVVEWDGVGLPPVGVVCEYVDRCKFTRLVEVLAFNQDEAWLRSIGSECESHSFTTKYLDAFSPIRTAEQVASEEIEAIRQFLIYEHCDGGLIGIAKALHESGYRKESKSCGS